MPRKQTQQEYVDDCLVIHDNFYSYPRTAYTTGRSKIIITCPRHGDFTQLAESHKQGHGCSVCAREATVAGVTLTQEIFDKRVADLNSKYDFSKAVFKRTNLKVIVICPEHGEFKTRPSCIFKGIGCPKCQAVEASRSQVSNTPEFVYKAQQAKDYFYSYPRTKYVNNFTDVIITCPLHGDFTQTPSNHLNGAGCPSCGKSGFNRNKPGTTYILTCGDITKVGITGRSLAKRLDELRKRGGLDFEVVASFYYKDGNLALNLETQVLRWLSANYEPIKTRFDGSTECFQSVDIAALLSFVTPLATENPSSTTPESE